MARSRGRNFQKILVSQTITGGMSSEEKQEEAKRWVENNKLLSSIEENTRGVGGAGGGKVEPDTEAGGPSIGLLGAMLAASIGTLVGAIQGHIKAIKFFGEKLLPNRLITGIGEKMSAMKNFFSKGMDRILGFFRGFRDMFGKAGGGTFTKIMDAMKSGVAAVKDFFKPITEAFKMVRTGGGGGIMKIIDGIKGAFSGFFNFFKGLGSSMKAFSGIFSAVAGVVAKIFLPLTVVLTLWDTVKGMIAGFSEDGIIGGITGAIEGFFNSLIFGPLDMIKGAASWVLDFFGFDKASAFLDSFSFEEMFSGAIENITNFINAIPEKIGQMIDWIGEKISQAMDAVAGVFDTYIIQPLGNFVQEYVIDPITSAFEQITGFFTNIKNQLSMFLADFGIPAVEIDLPMLDPFTIGPFFPFRPEEGTENISASQKSTVQSDSSGNVQEEFLENMTNTAAEASRVVVQGMSTVENADGTTSSTVGDAFVELDATTGRSTAFIGDEEVEIDNSTFRTIKARAQQGDLGMEELRDIVEEDRAYNDERLSWFDRRKVDVGYASARDILAEKIGETSVDNAVAMSSAGNGGGSNTTVVAPSSTVNNTTAVTPRPSIRNSNPSANSNLAYGIY